jgi:hypothetical protein
MTITPHLAPAPALVPAAGAAQQQGAGNLLRIVLVVLLIGTALLAWFLLRGYRGAGLAQDGQDDGDQGGGSRPLRGGGGGGPAGADRRPGQADGGASPEDPGSGHRAPEEKAPEARHATAGDHPGGEDSGENHPGGVTAAAPQGDDQVSDAP